MQFFYNTVIICVSVVERKQKKHPQIILGECFAVLCLFTVFELLLAS